MKRIESFENTEYGRSLISKSKMTASEKELFGLPLFYQLMRDPGFSIDQRAIDCNWWYEKHFRDSLAGFNPLHSKSYVSVESPLAHWLNNKNKNIRDLNKRDRFVHEALFLVHDYLHCWAYQAIAELAPHLRAGFGEFEPAKYEDYVFCHLLTEAVATVGLDYWYLGTVDLNDIWDIGTRTTTLTAAYHAKHQHEYDKVGLQVKVQSPDFFKHLATFYCNGEFEGAHINDLVRSPIVLAWLEHELTYGATQRSYTRQWLNYLHAVPLRTGDDLKKPVPCNKKWQISLMTDLGQLLWEKVKENKSHFFKPLPRRQVWQSSPLEKPDFRFLNLNTITDDEWLSTLKSDNMDQTSWKFFYNQFLAQYKLANIPNELLNVIKMTKEKLDVPTMKYLFKNQKRLVTKGSEQRDLMFLN